VPTTWSYISISCVLHRILWFILSLSQLCCLGEGYESRGWPGGGTCVWEGYELHPFWSTDYRWNRSGMIGVPTNNGIFPDPFHPQRSTPTPAHTHRNVSMEQKSVGVVQYLYMKVVPTERDRSFLHINLFVFYLYRKPIKYYIYKYIHLPTTLKSVLMAWAGAHLHSLEVLEMSTSIVLPNSLWYGKLYLWNSASISTQGEHIQPKVTKST
jgi:hypothetical protein